MLVSNEIFETYLKNLGDGKKCVEVWLIAIATVSIHRTEAFTQPFCQPCLAAPFFIQHLFYLVQFHQILLFVSTKLVEILLHQARTTKYFRFFQNFSVKFQNQYTQSSKSHIRIIAYYNKNYTARPIISTSHHRKISLPFRVNFCYPMVAERELLKFLFPICFL